MPMIESWVILDDIPVPVPPDLVRETLQTRVDRKQLETWLTSSSGRSLTFVTNSERAMVVLFDGEDGEQHAVDPEAGGSSKGFVLSNGQQDEYPDEDTVPIGKALRFVEHIVSTGSWPVDARWEVDR